MSVARPARLAACCLLNSCWCWRAVRSSSRAWRVLAQRRGALIGLGQLDPQPGEIRFELGEPRRGRRLPLARLREPRARAFDGRGQLAVAAREEHLLPPPQLVPQALIAACLGSLPLQGAALLLDLEDDVVDAGEILLRGFELELGGAPP